MDGSPEGLLFGSAVFIMRPAGREFSAVMHIGE